MNLLNMLQYLKGWDYVAFSKSEIVEKGAYKNIFSRTFKGWLLSLDFFSNDAYTSSKIIYLGTTAIVTPHFAFSVGAVEPPPMGMYVNLYLRPSILSTAGAYMGSIFTTAYPLPVGGLVRIGLGLEKESTQTTATAQINLTAIEITDEKAFLRSVRQVYFGWLGWFFGLLSNIPGLKYIGLSKEIKEVLE